MKASDPNTELTTIICPSPSRTKYFIQVFQLGDKLCVGVSQKTFHMIV